MPDLSAIRGYVEEVAAENARSRALQQELHLQTQRQVQALLNLQQVVSTPVRIPPMGGRATSPDLVLLVLEEMLAGRPETVLACGGGVSTVLLALTARQHGLDTRIVALEHLEQLRHQTELALIRHGVSDGAEVRWAPLEDAAVIEGRRTPWYAASALEDLDHIGVLVLGAKPDAPGALSHHPAIPLLRDRLAPDTVVIIDDLDAEQELQTWRELLPDFSYEQLDALQKPAGVFRRAAPRG